MQENCKEEVCKIGEKENLSIYAHDLLLNRLISFYMIAIALRDMSLLIFSHSHPPQIAIAQDAV